MHARRWATFLSLLTATTTFPLRAQAPEVSSARGVGVPPAGGDRLEYCARPLTLWIKIDSSIAPATRLVAGTGEIRGDEGEGRHRTSHEVVYIRSGWGLAIFGNDTSHLGPGSVVYVSPGRTHRFVSQGREPLEYFWVLGPMASAAGFREAARRGCPGGSQAPSVPARAPESVTPVLVLPPFSGERITYCSFPLTLTAKVDSQSVAGTLLNAATGVLRPGVEAGSHAAAEVVLITHGRGRAFAGADTVHVEPGSVLFNPGGIQHGFINEGPETLEYFIVYGPFDTSRSRAGFKRLAARPGPWCGPAQAH